MLSEKESIEYLFNKNFGNCKSKKIMLYGEASAIRLILRKFPDFNFTGIVIKNHEQKTCLGRKSLDISAIKQGLCDFIIMIDLPNELREGLLRLGPTCAREKIPIYDLRGISFIEKKAYLSKAEQIAFDFQTNFFRWKKSKMAICGDENTIKELGEVLRQYCIVGFLDINCEKTEVLGQKVLTYEKILEHNVNIVVILSKGNEIENIYRKYGLFCQKNKIQLFSIDGTDLHEYFGEAEAKTENNPYFNINEEHLKNGIEWNDVICFSIFDCLLMKKTLIDEDFEKVLESRPYKNSRWENIEKLVLLRQKMIELFHYAVEKEKIIYLVDETKIPEQYIEKILNNYKITEYSKLFICNEGNKCEKEKIFRIIKNSHPEKRFLYIGTNSHNEAQMASKYGMNYFRIKSASEMLDISSYALIRAYLHNTNERAIVGLLISHIFNNPFSLFKSNSRVKVSNIEEFAKIFVAPLVTALVLWIAQQTKEKSYYKILFSSRDGYLICKLYNKLRINKEFCNNPEGIYFLISRRVASCAGVSKQEDLEWLFSLNYEDGIEETLKEKFGFTEEEVEGIDKKSKINWILENKKLIFAKANRLKENYIKYIQGLEIADTYKYGFYDMVSSGTGQYFLSKILHADIEGLYLCWYDIGDSKRRNLPIISMYTNNRVSPENGYSDYVEGGCVYNDYDLLEVILSSSEPSLKEFDSSGNPIYLHEKRTMTQICSMKKAQKAIEDFFDEYIELMYIGTEKISEKVVEELFKYKDTMFTDERCEDIDELINFDDLGLLNKI